MFFFVVVPKVHSDHDASLLDGPVNLVDSVYETGVTEGQLFVQGNLPVLSHSRAHDLLKS